MINLISTQAGSDTVSGPAKVYRNLVKGLDAIGYPYVVNRSLDSTRRVWVHDDVTALRYVSRARARAVVGPNLYVLPRDIPRTTDLTGVLYLHPCEWAIAVWRAAGFNACEMAAWPVGIDLDEFRPRREPGARTEVLVYHKLRRDDELDRICSSLVGAAVPHRVLRYGGYDEAGYIAALQHAGLVVWHGCHESQGIALQEALAMDVPVLVCDASRLSEEVGGHFPLDLDRVPVTAAPYFDATCGRRTYRLDDVGVMAAEMLEQRPSFSPRKYIEANLSLEGQARRFVALWEHFGLTAEEGFLEEQRSGGRWRRPLRARAPALALRAASDLRLRLAEVVSGSRRRSSA